MRSITRCLSVYAKTMTCHRLYFQMKASPRIESPSLTSQTTTNNLQLVVTTDYFHKTSIGDFFFFFVSRSVCTQLQYRYFNNLSFFGGMLLPVALIPMIAWLLLWSSTRDLYWPFTVLKATPLPNNWKLSAVFEFQYNHKIQCRKWVWSIWMSQFEFYVPLSFCLVFVKWDTPLHTKSHDKYEQTNNNKH